MASIKQNVEAVDGGEHRDEMQEDVFRVIVHPDTPTEVTARGARLIVRGACRWLEDKKIVISRSARSRSPRGGGTMGGKIVIRACSPILDERPQGSAAGTEFFITVVGAGNENKPK